VARGAVLPLRARRFHDRFPDRKWLRKKRKQSLFREAAPLLAPALERVEIPFRGGRRARLSAAPRAMLPAGLCDHVGRPRIRPKEDALTLSNLLVARGLATLAFDGTGRAEMFHRMETDPRLRKRGCRPRRLPWCSGRKSIRPDRHRRTQHRRPWACQAAAKDKRVNGRPCLGSRISRAQHSGKCP
jgi:hypothetical protein